MSDHTIVVNRACPGLYIPDFDTADESSIDFVLESSPGRGRGGGASSPKKDVYYAHKALTVGSRLANY
ncbi:hypothetical protein ACHAXR_008401 [Thalassiosira sp. AJA248-18]